MTVPAFPLSAPFRIDQVTQAPGLLVGLLVAEVLMAMLLHLAALRHWRRLWWAALAALLADVG